MSTQALERQGRLVAIEGLPSVVSTQLQLLPRSPTVLIIPSIEEYLNEREGCRDDFDARRYTLLVLRALEARYREAMGFLRGGNHSSRRRIVFLNGGMCAAHALCIAAIRKNVTGGSLSRAGIIFDRILGTGLDGAISRGVLTLPPRTPVYPDSTYDRLSENFLDEEVVDGDRCIWAMRKADALYEKTASLDHSAYSDAKLSPVATASLAVPNIRSPRLSRQSCSSCHSQLSSSLASPDALQVEYGEARLVQMQPAVPTTLKRVKSADRWYTRDELDGGTRPSKLPRTYSTRTVSLVDNVAETVLVLRGQGPAMSKEKKMAPHHEDLIILVEDAALDPVLRFASDSLRDSKAGHLIHICMPHGSAQPVSDGSLPTTRQAAVETQNSLRSLLAELLPASLDHDPLLFTELANTDSLGESTSQASPETEQPYAMIIALGARAGVPKEYHLRIARQLEDLGRKPDGTHARRTDLGRLIASAMQSYTSQPLATQTTNPFAEPSLLAALVAAEIRKQLAAAPEARYMVLDFPAQHLPAVLTMQSIMGAEAFKIAGLVGRDDEDLVRGFNRRQGRNRGGHHYSTGSPEVSPSSPSFAQVDYLLHCQASEAEEATFLDTIRKRLTALDPSYGPSPYIIPSSPRGRAPDSPPASPPPAFLVPATYRPHPGDHHGRGRRAVVVRPASPDPTIASSRASSRKTAWSFRLGRPRRWGGEGESGGGKKGVVGGRKNIGRLFSRHTPAAADVPPLAYVEQVGPVARIGGEDRGYGQEVGEEEEEEAELDLDERRLLPPLFGRGRKEGARVSPKALRMLGII